MMGFVTAIVVVVLAVFAGAASGEVIESPPFVIEFAPQDRGTATRSIDVLQQAMLLYAPRLPAGEEPIRVIIIPSIDAFEEAFGVEARNVQAFASGGEYIVMKPPRLLRPGTNYDAVLRHELLHVLIARNTNPENMPRWFNEGIAMLVSNELEWSGPTTVAWMYLSGDLIAYTDLHAAFADPGDEEIFGEAYAQSHSMTRYLYETLGEEGFWSFVRRLRELPFNQTLRERTGMTPLEFYAAWQDSLRSTAWGSWLVSGFFVFQIAAVLLLLAYWRKHRYRRERYREWAVEDAVNAIFEDGDDKPTEAEKLDEYLDEWEEDEEGRWWY